MRTLKIDSSSPYRRLIGVGGVGTGVFFKLAGDHTLGRNESRSGELLDVRDYCKLHIVLHYVAKLLGETFEILPIAKVGDDAPGRFVLREMQEAGIDTRFIETSPGKPTLFSVCFQYPDGSGGNITTDNSAAGELRDADVDRVRGQFDSDPKRTIALAVPEVSLAVRHHFLTIATQAGAFRAASFVLGEISQAKDAGIFKLLDMVALNESEASELLGFEFSEDRIKCFADKCLSFLNNSYPGMHMIVSLGARGVMGFADEHWSFCSAPAVAVASTAGAGDALLAGVISGLAAGIPFLNTGLPGHKRQNAPLQSALELGMILASYSVTSPHTIHPSACWGNLEAFVTNLGLRLDQEVEGLLVESGTTEVR